MKISQLLAGVLLYIVAGLSFIGVQAPPCQLTRSSLVSDAISPVSTPAGDSISADGPIRLHAGISCVVSFL
jgi:hypothetical protein